MLAKPLHSMKDLNNFCNKKKHLICDLKYDGQRTLIQYKKGQNIKLISRNNKQQTYLYEQLSKQIYKQLQKCQEIQSIQIDAEIVCIEQITQKPLPMQILLRRKGKTKQQLNKQLLNIEQNLIKIKQIIYCFDILQYNNKNIKQQILLNRKKYIPNNKIIYKCQSQELIYPKDKNILLELYYNAINRKYQGLIIKGANDIYWTNGTRMHWGKLKKGCKLMQNHHQSYIDLDLIVMGMDRGKGKYSSIYSSFLLGTYYKNKIIPLSKIGTGFTTNQLNEINNKLNNLIVQQIPHQFNIPKTIKMDAWIKPSIIWQINIQQFTRSPLYQLGFKQGFGGISLRFPVFQRVRNDKENDISLCTNGESILKLINS